MLLFVVVVVVVVVVFVFDMLFLFDVCFTWIVPLTATITSFDSCSQSSYKNIVSTHRHRTVFLPCMKLINSRLLDCESYTATFGTTEAAFYNSAITKPVVYVLALWQKWVLTKRVSIHSRKVIV